MAKERTVTIPLRALKHLVKAAGWEWVKRDHLIFARPKETLNGAIIVERKKKS